MSRPADQQGVITIAIGDGRHLRMARALARSLIHHCPHIPRALITDSPDAGVRDLFDVIIESDRRPEPPVLHKLGLDGYTPFRETLYLDADCLVVRSLDEIFSLFRRAEFAYVGQVVTEGRWYADVPATLERFGIPWIARLNGGLYYFRSGPTADRIFSRVRAIADHYDALGFDLWRMVPADEPAFGVALAEEGIEPFPDGGRSMRTPLGLQGALRIDAVAGACAFVKEGERVEPAVVHFTNRFWQSHPIYWRERARIRLAVGPRWLRPLGTPGAWVAFAVVCALRAANDLWAGMLGRIRRMLRRPAG